MRGIPSSSFVPDYHDPTMTTTSQLTTSQRQTGGNKDKDKGYHEIRSLLSQLPFSKAGGGTRPPGASKETPTPALSPQETPAQ
jgi:hypothetical protein